MTLIYWLVIEDLIEVQQLINALSRVVGWLMNDEIWLGG